MWRIVHAGKWFDGEHLSGVTTGAGAEADAVELFEALVRAGFLCGRVCLTDQSADDGQALISHAVAEEAVVADAGKARGQGVQKEPSEELGSG